MLQHSDAALIIGDPAMRIPRDQFRVFDLATLWHEFTGLGFVFAMWMARKDSIEKIRFIDLAAARREGLAHLDEITTGYANEIGLPENEITEYLTENVAFKVDEQMRHGLELYFELAKEHKLIQRARSLEFVNCR